MGGWGGRARGFGVLVLVLVLDREEGDGRGKGGGGGVRRAAAEVGCMIEHLGEARGGGMKVGDRVA